MRLFAVPSILLILATSYGNVAGVTTTPAALSTTAATPVTPASLMVITPETTPATRQANEPTPSPTSSKTGRAYYKTDDDYAVPSTGHSAYEVAATYPAGHSAQDGSWSSSDDTDPKSHDVDAMPYHSFQSASGLNNPAHDPTLYQTFVPHYVATGQGHPAVGPGHEVAMPTFVVPASSWQSASTPLAVHDYILQPVTAVISGTGGPTDQIYAEHEHDTHHHQQLASYKKDSDSRAVALLATVVPRSFALVLVRSVGFLLSTLGVVLFGGVVTSAVCALTPLCTLTITLLPLFVGLRRTASSTLKKVFGGPVAGDLSVNIQNDGESTTSNDRIAKAEQLVDSAIVKYEKMQDNREEVATPANTAANA